MKIHHAVSLIAVCSGLLACGSNGGGEGSSNTNPFGNSPLSPSNEQVSNNTNTNFQNSAIDNSDFQNTNSNNPDILNTDFQNANTQSTNFPNNDTQSTNNSLPQTSNQQSVNTTGSQTNFDTGSNDLQGSWVSACSFDPDDQIAYFSALTISGNRFTVTQSADFFTTDCSGTAILHSNLLGTLVVPGGVTSVATGVAKHIDITYARATFTASQGFQDALANQGTDLRSFLNSQGIADPDNVPLSQAGIDSPYEYTIYQIIGNQLLLGDIYGALDGSSEALRPTTLSSYEILTKR